ncbi:unnamed protein product [Blepharisma stoltei]|uniref:Uncharacterized protein n=1 Tax=Blepharisma stoltei TaxID=1481888 RepID=A0AAU9JT95_9CILI|nr:unnamed protein product [Blepharisma stoltei]
MDLFAIGDEEEKEEQIMHPAFMPNTLPKLSLPKGSIITDFPSQLFPCKEIKKRKGLTGMILKNKPKILEREISFEDEFMYVYERKKGKLIVRHVWVLSRLLNIEIKKSQPTVMTFVFANKSLDPLDDYERKTVDLYEMGWFIQTLKNQLDQLCIDFQFDV